MSIKTSTLAILSGTLMSLTASSARAEDLQQAFAFVDGPENRLLEFHQNLLGFLPDPDLQNSAIICDKCTGLRANPTPTTVKYTFFRDHERLEAFVLAWGKVQATEANKFVILRFESDSTTKDCGPPLPQPCVPASFCKATPGCDEVRGAPCTKCDGVPGP